MTKFAENDNTMSSEQRIQTVLRLPKHVYYRVKLYAEREGRSFNNYVETLLAKATDMDWPTIPKEDLVVSEEILNLVPKSGNRRKFTKEELENDPKLSYLAEKYGL